MAATVDTAARSAARNAARSWAPWLGRLAIVALLVVTALSTYHGATTERWAYDLDVSEAFQKVNFSWARGLLFFMGVRGVAGLVMAGVTAWLWFRGRRVEAVMIVILLIPDASSFILRDIFDRPRPTAELVEVFGGPQGFSYPSGTALHTMLFYGWMLYLLPKLADSSAIRWRLGGFLVLWMLLQGFWVIHHGRHWPSDVLGGYLYGAMYLVGIIMLYPVVQRWDRRHPNVLARLDERIRGLLAKVGVRPPTRPA